MNLDRLPRAAMLAQLARLAVAFGRQPHHGEPEQVAAVYAGALTGVSPDALERGVDAAIREERFFPRPAILRRYALEAQHSIQHTEYREADHGDRCQQCGTHRWYAGFSLPDGTMAPRLRCRCAEEGAGWNTQAALAWIEIDARLLQAGYAAPLDWRAA